MCIFIGHSSSTSEKCWKSKKTTHEQTNIRFRAFQVSKPWYSITIFDFAMLLLSLQQKKKKNAQHFPITFHQQRQKPFFNMTQIFHFNEKKMMHEMMTINVDNKAIINVMMKALLFKNTNNRKASLYIHCAHVTTAA